MPISLSSEFGAGWLLFRQGTSVRASCCNSAKHADEVSVDRNRKWSVFTYVSGGDSVPTSSTHSMPCLERTDWLQSRWATRTKRVLDCDAMVLATVQRSTSPESEASCTGLDSYIMFLRNCYPPCRTNLWKIEAAAQLRHYSTGHSSGLSSGSSPT